MGPEGQERLNHPRNWIITFAEPDHHLRGIGSVPSQSLDHPTFGQRRTTTRSCLTVRTGITARKGPASWSQFLLGRSVSLEAADAQGAAAG